MGRASTGASPQVASEKGEPLEWAAKKFYVTADVNTSTQLDAAVIAGAIVAVTVVLTCLAVVLLRYMYRHKGSYCTNEAKGTEYAETADAALRNDPTLQDGVADSKREYFI